MCYENIITYKSMIVYFKVDSFELLMDEKVEKLYKEQLLMENGTPENIDSKFWDSPTLFKGWWLG